MHAVLLQSITLVLFIFDTVLLLGKLNILLSLFYFGFIWRWRRGRWLSDFHPMPSWSSAADRAVIAAITAYSLGTLADQTATSAIRPAAIEHPRPDYPVKRQPRPLFHIHTRMRPSIGGLCQNQRSATIVCKPCLATSGWKTGPTVFLIWITTAKQ